MPLAFLPGRPAVQLERDNIMDWKRISISQAFVFCQFNDATH